MRSGAQDTHGSSEDCYHNCTPSSGMFECMGSEISLAQLEKKNPSLNPRPLSFFAVGVSFPYGLS